MPDGLFRGRLVTGAFVAASFKEGLEDKDGGDLIDDVFAADALAVGGAAMAEGVEVAVGFGGGKALIPEMDGEAELFAERGGKGLSAGGLRALVAGHVEWVADDGFGDRRVLAQDAGDGFQVVLQAPAVQREERLGGVAERVGQGQADAALANIKAENARDGVGGFD